MDWTPDDLVVADGDSRRERAFLKSSEQVRGRYLRCRSAWQSHLDRTQCAVEAGLGRCVHRRVALIIGGGMLHDVPLERLSDSFERVVIVDVVHLWRSVLAARKYPNVRQVCLDVSGFLAWGEGRPPQVGMPSELLALGKADFVVSLNLLSQLAVVPRLEEASRISADELDDLSRRMVQNHLAVLEYLATEVTLVTDFERHEVYADGRSRSGGDILHGVNAGPFEEEWVWNIAPIPEASSEYHVLHRVGVRHWTACGKERS
jgi:hypothetical protein